MHLNATETTIKKTAEAHDVIAVLQAASDCAEEFGSMLEVAAVGEVIQVTINITVTE